MSTPDEVDDNIRHDNDIICNDGRPNGSAGTPFIDESNSLAEGSGSDDCGDKLTAKESDPLQPKMPRSRSAHKFRDVKEVCVCVCVVFKSSKFPLIPFGYCSVSQLSPFRRNDNVKHGIKKSNFFWL